MIQINMKQNQSNYIKQEQQQLPPHIGELRTNKYFQRFEEHIFVTNYITRLKVDDKTINEAQRKSNVGKQFDQYLYPANS